MKNIMDFIKFALSHANPATVPSGAKIAFPVGDGGIWQYLWGTRGQVVTQALLDARFKSYYSKDGWDRKEYDAVTKGWVANRYHVTDCEGLLDAFLGNDVNANTNYTSYCTSKGKCSSICRPYVVGEAVFMGTATKKTHVGWVCGFDKHNNPLVVENRGLKYGLVITNLVGRKWVYRGLMTKKFSYADSSEQGKQTPFVFTRELKKGMKGNDVIELKKLLITKGYNKGITVDTKDSKNFGSNTAKLVKEYQRDVGLVVDGKAGRQTITSLGGIFE